MQQPILFLFLGYPGAGKTSVARIIEEQTGAVHLWADHIRRERLGDPQPEYSHAENLELYDYLNQRAADLLEAGKSVIFDTNFKFYTDRQHLRSIAESCGARTVVVWIKTPLDVARHRATAPHHQSTTRVHGAMSVAVFDRLSAGLEEPQSDEETMVIDGEHINSEIITHKLADLIDGRS